MDKWVSNNAKVSLIYYVSYVGGMPYVSGTSITYIICGWYVDGELIYYVPYVGGISVTYIYVVDMLMVIDVFLPIRSILDDNDIFKLQNKH